MKSIYVTLLIGVATAGLALAAGMPKVGDVAPDFTAPASDGTTVHLKDVIGKGNIVLYFYPKDETPGCTKEACGIRDSFSEIKGMDAIVYGVSFDSIASHKAFIARYKLPFVLLSDTDKKIAEEYGAATTDSPVANRVTFIINKAGKIAFVFLRVNPTTHSAEVREALATLE